jgi:hypothetical protein
MMDDGCSRVDLESLPDPVSGRDTFVVRIWSAGDPDEARGHVQHIRSRQSAYFATRQRLLAFIEERLRVTSPTPQAGAARTRRRPAADGQGSP